LTRKGVNEFDFFGFWGRNVFAFFVACEMLVAQTKKSHHSHNGFVGK
jgi:hypothetical protein